MKVRLNSDTYPEKDGVYLGNTKHPTRHALLYVGRDSLAVVTLVPGARAASVPSYREYAVKDGVVGYNLPAEDRPSISIDLSSAHDIR